MRESKPVWNLGRVRSQHLPKEDTTRPGRARQRRPAWVVDSVLPSSRRIITARELPRSMADSFAKLRATLKDVKDTVKRPFQGGGSSSRQFHPPAVDDFASSSVPEANTFKNMAMAKNRALSEDDAAARLNARLAAETRKGPHAPLPPPRLCCSHARDLLLACT